MQPMLLGWLNRNPGRTRRLCCIESVIRSVMCEILIVMLYVEPLVLIMSMWCLVKGVVLPQVRERSILLLKRFGHLGTPGMRRRLPVISSVLKALMRLTLFLC